MRTINSTNTTQSLNTSVSLHKISNRTSASSGGVVSHDPNQLGYGLGRLLRGAYDRVSNAWQHWWTPQPSSEEIAHRRQRLIYRKGLEACVRQLDRVLEAIRKNPRDRHNLEKIKSLASDFSAYVQPTTIAGLRAYQQQIFKPLENKIARLANPQLKHVLRQLLPIISQDEVRTVSGVEELTVKGEPLLTALGASTALEASSKVKKVKITKRSLQQQTIAFPHPFNLTTLDGRNGFVVDGLGEGDLLGWSVNTAGDINGDGQDDLVLGSRWTGPGGRTRAGTVYVLFGQPGSWVTRFDLTTLDGSNGFVVEGLGAGDELGWSVSMAGDINGDGWADLVLGAHDASPSGFSDAGAAYVLLGKASGWPVRFDLTTLNGTNGFSVDGLTVGDDLGHSVGIAGDMNRDGRSDLALGAIYASPGARSQAGTMYVLFGQSSSWAGTFDLSTLNGSNGFVVEGLATDDFLGGSVSIAGDINGDGQPDMVLGAYSASTSGRSQAGMVYVLFGQLGGWGTTFDLNSLNGSNGFAVGGLVTGDALGWSVSAVGDINGDDQDDLILGAHRADPSGRIDAGTAYVLFGKPDGWGATFDLSTLNGSNGFAVEGLVAGGELGCSVSAAGDINGDAQADLILGAHGANPSGRIDAGTAYVLFGQHGGWPAVFDLTTLNGRNGFAVEGINAGDRLGESVSTAGDINGDGRTDLVLGAPGNISNQTGAVYVIFGVNLDTPCLTAQPLQWLHHDIQITQGQHLRLSPVDISAGCGGNLSQSYEEAYFTVTGIRAASLQQRNASDAWNIGLSFWGADLALARVALMHDGSSTAPELNLTVTDGQTTLPETPITIRFNTTTRVPQVQGVDFVIQVNGQTVLTPDQFQITEVNGKLENVVLEVSSIQGGYFVSQANLTLPVKEFSYYQVTKGQIFFVHNGSISEVPQVQLDVDDGSGQKVSVSPLVTFFNVQSPTAEESVPIPLIAGVVSAVAVAAAVAGIGLFCYRRHREHLKDKEARELAQYKDDAAAMYQVSNTRGP